MTQDKQEQDIKQEELEQEDIEQEEPHHTIIKERTIEEELGDLDKLEDGKENIEKTYPEGEELEVATFLSEYFYGEINYIKYGEANLTFIPTKKFVVDKYDLIHFGIIDSAGQFCALAAINQPNGIISSTKTEFLAPVKKDMVLEYEAKANYNGISKKAVKVTAKYNDIIMYESIVNILVLEEHIFANKIIDSKSI